MNKSEEINKQSESIKHFLKAQEHLYKKDFPGAEAEMNLYRENINYDSFDKCDNRKVQNPLLSVIVVAYSTNELLLDCLSSLRKQNEKQFEIIVIDNGKNEIVEAKIKSLPVLYVKSPENFILSEGRNIGAYFAKAPIIASLDDDAVVPPDYIKNIVKVFEAKDISAIRGRVLPKKKVLGTPGAYDLGNNVIPSNITAEGNSAYLKEDYINLGGMNPLLFGHEGLDFSYRMFKKSNKIKTFYVPSVLIYHNPATEAKSDIKRERYEIMNEYLLWLHPDIWHFNGIVNSATKDVQETNQDNQDKEIPVVLVTYNRPEHTKQVIDSLRKHKVKNLYVFSDAPKSQKDVEKVIQTRKLIESIDWTIPEVVFQKENKGLAKSITSAVELVFKKYDKIILLEDDCVPGDYFFSFMDECLIRYKNNEKVFGVSGYTVPLPDELLKDYKNDVYFYPRIGSWGWATWKEKWQKKESNLKNLLKKLSENNIDISQGGSDVPQMLAGMLNGNIKDVWTISWLLTVYLNKGFYVYPTRSHIINIGMDGTGIHCGTTDKYNSKLADKPSTVFPSDLVIDEEISQNFKKYYDVVATQPEIKTSMGRNLKVVHLCSQDFGGAGKAAYRLHKGLQSIGIDSTFISVNKQSGDPSVKVIPDQSSEEVKDCINPPVYQSTLMNDNYARWWGQLRVYPQRSRSIELFTDTISPFNLNFVKEIAEADIINLHWTSGMLNYENIVSALKGKKIVWTLHDMNPFTGGCHYSIECEKFKSGCGNCSLLNSGTEDDLSKKIFNIKEKVYKNLTIQVVTPSKWLGEETKISKLFSGFPVEVIPNGLPTETFMVYNKNEIKKKLGIPKQYKIILFGADNVANERKGFVYLLKALEKLSSNQNIILATFGNVPGDIKLKNKFKIINFGSVPGENELATIYNVADIFVLPSLQDNLPNTVLESLACGTPVVAFNIGGIPDMIEHKKTGYLAEYKNPQSLAKGIKWAITNKNSEKISHYCREEALAKYSLELQAKKYLTIYQKLLEKDKAESAEVSEASEITNGGDREIKVSAIVSTYNSEKFIRGCLDNLINQTLYVKGELEIIVINSGSQQDEGKIVKEYQRKHKNIKYLKTSKETIYQAWNRGIKAANGKYITNANTDDRHRRDALEVLAQTLDTKNDIALVYADSKVTGVENEKFETAPATGFLLWPEYNSTNLFRICYVGPQPMWRKSLHKKYGYFDGSFKSAGDYEFWLRIVNNEKFEHLNAVLGLYLLSDESVEHVNQQISLQESEKARKKYWKLKTDRPVPYGTYLCSYRCSKNTREDVKFSVVIPTCDRPESLRKALNSLASQTYKNFEVVVVNDGKNDVKQILKEFEDELNYQYIRNLINRERSASRNNGIKVSKGKYILFLDDDDLLYPEHLKIISDNIIDGIPVAYTDAVRAVYEKFGDIYKIIEKSVPYSIDYDRNKLLIGNIAPINCFAIRRDLLFKAGLFNETLNVLEDWELLLRLSEFTIFKHVKENTCEVSWRQDGSSTTSSRGELFDIVRKQIYKKYEKEIQNIPNVEQIVNEFNTIWKKDFKSNIPVVSIIALSYNQLQYTKTFIESVLKFTKASFELIIVDNASDKDTVQYLRDTGKSDDRINVIFNKENTGFPKGVNQAIKVAKGNYILIANNDIIVTDGWLERMIEVAESEEDIGLVGPLSNSVSGVQLDKEAIYKSIEGMHVYAAELKKKNKEKSFEFPRVAFLCTLIKRNVINKLGGLDERFSPGNFEDDDFCLRTQLAGYKTVIVQDVFIHHFGSKSFTAEGTRKYAEQLDINKKIFVDKWGADPEEIWLKGKEFKKRSVFYPLMDDKFLEAVQRAQLCLQDNEYSVALTYLQSVLDDETNLRRNNQVKIDSLFHLAGKICLIERKYKVAINYFLKELDNNEGSLRAYQGLGDAYSALGEKEEAAKMYQKASEEQILNEFTEVK